MPSEPVITLLLQIPLAGVVAFVVGMFLKHLSKSEERQDLAQSRMIVFLTAQEESNRNFITEMNNSHGSSMARLAEEVKQNGHEIARVNGMLQAHDARSTERAKTMPLPHTKE